MTNSVFIEGRSWFDKSAGNSYWATRLWIDCAVVAQLPITYGRQYVEDSITWLVDNGYLPAHKHLSELRKQGIAVYKSLTPSLKRDLFRAWLPDEN